jgi:hypothetical protein
MLTVVSNPWIPPERIPPPEPLLEHVRDLWTLHGIQSKVTAAIYRNDFGLELRIDLAGELMQSQLSRFGEQPLILRADRVKAELIEQGWFANPTNATYPT